MKKVFSKFTKERVRKFQIETSIYEDENGCRFVGKRAIYPEGEEHILHMIKNYENNKEFYVKCEKRKNEVIFPYVVGSNYYEMLLLHLHAKDKAAVMGIMEAYKDLLEKLYPSLVDFEQSDDFNEVFGVITEEHSYKAAYGINIDLTLDNIILCDNKPVIIDYEWNFDFQIPVKFPIYRAIYALYVKHGQLLSDLISEKELYGYFNISEADKSVFAQMNKCFGEYVEGGKLSYNNILKRYEKQSWDIAGLYANKHYMQVYYNDGTGYSEEKCDIHFFGANEKKVVINAKNNLLENCKEVRIDPIESSAVIKLTKLEIETRQYIRKITLDEVLTNAKISENGYMIFVSDDPQIIINVPDHEVWIDLRIEYEFISDDEKCIDVMSKYYESKNIQMRREYDTKYQLMADALQTHQRELAELKIKEQLLRDKIAYIEGTKVYRNLLKNKVDSLGLWRDL